MKVIELDITNEEDLFDKYNKDNISQELINYLVESTFAIDLKEKIKLIIHSDLKKQICIPIIIRGLKMEYNKNVLNYKHNSKIQLIYLVLGVIILFISSLINGVVLKEVALIGGWVFIWSMIEIELFTDMKILRKRKILKRLIECEKEEL